MRTTATARDVSGGWGGRRAGAPTLTRFSAHRTAGCGAVSPVILSAPRELAVMWSVHVILLSAPRELAVVLSVHVILLAAPRELAVVLSVQ